MLTVVAITSLALAVILFLIFGYQLYLRRAQVTHQLKTAEDSLDLAKLVEAFAKLADSMEKRGPLAMSLFASMFFMVMALLAAGFGK
jgi:ammonia channel protein AmtB